MSVEIINPEFKQRVKRKIVLCTVAYLALQATAANAVGLNITGEIVNALKDDSSVPTTQTYERSSQQFEVNTQPNPWRLNPNYSEIIDSLPIESYKKEYLKFVAEGVEQVRRAGYEVNPQAMFVKAPFETTYGTDSIVKARNNHFGMQGGENVHATTEFENGQYVPKASTFKNYNPNDPYASFFDYADMVTNPARRRDIYWDAIDCGGFVDARMYFEGMVHRKGDDCNIEAWQGEIDPLTNKLTQSYATDPRYIDKGMNMIDFLRADEIFILK
jgi:flagellum-specific peptidoglycan hydrolase FlgJ